MGIFIVLLFWLIIGGIIALIISLPYALISRKHLKAFLFWMVITLLFPSYIIGVNIYMNRDMSPEEHWAKEFGPLTPHPLQFMNVDSAFSSDVYLRKFWFKSDSNMIYTLAKTHGFTLIDSDYSGPRTIIYRSDEEYAFSKACDFFLHYEALGYFNNSVPTNKSSVWMRYCPETQEGFINIVDID